MLRELISRFTDPGTPPPVLSQVSQVSLSQCLGILLAKPPSVAKVATVAVAKVENSKIKGAGQTGVESKEASALAPETGLDWLPGPPTDDGPDLADWSACFDLRDVCRSCGVRIVRAGKRVVAIFPASLDPNLVAYTSALLDDARPFLSDHLGKLPVLPPAGAVIIILAIMREHPGLRFCRGDGGSRWPLYPKHWTAGQKATVQSLWCIAGEALDLDGFVGM
jgi:hypothetical protein